LWKLTEFIYINFSFLMTTSLVPLIQAYAFIQNQYCTMHRDNQVSEHITPCPQHQTQHFIHEWSQSRKICMISSSHCSIKIGYGHLGHDTTKFCRRVARLQRNLLPHRGTKWRHNVPRKWGSYLWNSMELHPRWLHSSCTTCVFSISILISYPPLPTQARTPTHSHTGNLKNMSLNQHTK
jgi:hypothetical protein